MTVHEKYENWSRYRVCHKHDCSLITSMRIELKPIFWFLGAILSGIIKKQQYLIMNTPQKCRLYLRIS